MQGFARSITIKDKFDINRTLSLTGHNSYTWGYGTCCNTLFCSEFYALSNGINRFSRIQLLKIRLIFCPCSFTYNVSLKPVEVLEDLSSRPSFKISSNTLLFRMKFMWLRP